VPPELVDMRTSADLARFVPLLFEHTFVYATGMQAWEARDPTLARPVAAPLERCAEILGVDLATVRQVAACIEPYVRVDGTKVWSLMQLERHLQPEAYGRVRGGYITRRRARSTGT
jgi:hypothetical protein